MATLSLTVVPGKALKDGKHKVRISVAHNSQTRYILTDVILNSTKEWKNGKVVKRDDATYLNTKLLKRMQEVQHIIDETRYIEGLSCAELVETILQTRARKTHTLASAIDEMLEVSTAKETTKERYRRQFKSITSVIPETTLVSHITPIMVQRFIKKRGAEIAPITLQTQVTLFSQLLNFCQRNGYTEYRVKPTDGFYKRIIAVRQNWLTPDEIRFIRDREDTHKAFNRFRDMFMLSYYLGGINIIDLARINFNECTTTLRYIRSKTERKAKVNPFVEFEIPDEAKPIIEKYKGEDGKLIISNCTDIDHCHDLGSTIRRFRKDIGLPNLTFYSARKSFAQHAFSLGESESVIDYILGHSLGGVRNKMLFSYIKVTPDMATACVRKVCDFIASSENL
jgi:integrase